MKQICTRKLIYYLNIDYFYGFEMFEDDKKTGIYLTHSVLEFDIYEIHFKIDL